MTTATDREKARELLRKMIGGQVVGDDAVEQHAAFRALRERQVSYLAAALTEARNAAIEECDERWGSAVAEWSATVSSHPGCDIAEAIIKRALKGTP